MSALPPSAAASSTCVGGFSSDSVALPSAVASGEFPVSHTTTVINKLTHNFKEEEAKEEAAKGEEKGRRKKKKGEKK